MNLDRDTCYDFSNFLKYYHRLYVPIRTNIRDCAYYLFDTTFVQNYFRTSLEMDQYCVSFQIICRCKRAPKAVAVSLAKLFYMEVNSKITTIW